ncbi:MAG: hypothetical protein JXR91_15635 [Deltaproteobacteria bacterium]|nr:hypothetical protein [Deltaproteobacteria bacterium]
MYKIVTILLVLSIQVIVSSVHATDLTGKISLTNEFMQQLMTTEDNSEINNAKGYWNEPNGIKPIAPPRVDLSSDFGVVLVREGETSPKGDEVKSVDVLTGKLDQSVIVVRPQSRVKFIIRSPFDHELYSPFKHDFKPQKQGNNSFRPIDFYTPGIFEIKDKLFPHFQSWVVVTPATYILKIDKDGTFKFAGAEPGNYSLKVFFKGHWIYNKTVIIDGKKQEINASLSVISDEKAAEDKDKDNSSKDKKDKDDENGKKDDASGPANVTDENKKKK